MRLISILIIQLLIITNCNLDKVYAKKLDQYTLAPKHVFQDEKETKKLLGIFGIVKKLRSRKEKETFKKVSSIEKTVESEKSIDKDKDKEKKGYGNKLLNYFIVVFIVVIAEIGLGVSLWLFTPLGFISLGICIGSFFILLLFFELTPWGIIEIINSIQEKTDIETKEVIVSKPPIKKTVKEGKEDERKRDEERRRQEEQRKSEESKLKLAEQRRKAEEEQRLTEQRRKEEEEQRLVEQRRKTEEEQRLAEQRRRAEEEQRLANQRRRAEEEQRLAEQRRKTEEEQRLANQRRKAEEEQRLAEQRRKTEEEQRLVEQRRKTEEEQRLVEQRRKIEEQRRLAEQRRQTEEQRRRDREARRPGVGPQSTVGDGNCAIHAFEGFWQNGSYRSNNTFAARNELAGFMEKLKPLFKRIKEKLGIFIVEPYTVGQAADLEQGLKNIMNEPDVFNLLTQVLNCVNAVMHSNYSLVEFIFSEEGQRAFNEYIVEVKRNGRWLYIEELYILGAIRGVRIILHLSHDILHGGNNNLFFVPELRRYGFKKRTRNVHVYNNGNPSISTGRSGSHYERYNLPGVVASDFILETPDDENIKDLADRYVVPGTETGEVLVVKTKNSAKFNLKDSDLFVHNILSDGLNSFQKMQGDFDINITDSYKILGKYSEIGDFIKNQKVEIGYVKGISNDCISRVRDDGTLFIGVSDKLKDKKDSLTAIIVTRGIYHELIENWLKSVLKEKYSDSYSKIDEMLFHWRENIEFKGLFEGAVEGLALNCIKQGWLGVELNLDNLYKAYENLFNKKVYKKMLGMTENPSNIEEQTFDMLSLIENMKEVKSVNQGIENTQKTHVVLHYA